MKNVVWLISYRLNNGVSDEEFLQASAACNSEVLSKQKGCISWEVLRNGDTWVDLVRWETAEDAKNAETAGADNPVAGRFYSMIDMASCKHELYIVEKSH